MWYLGSSLQIDRGKVETVTDFMFLGSEIIVDSNYSHEIGRASCRERVETVADFIFGGSKITAAMKLKDAYALEGKL